MRKTIPSVTVLLLLICSVLLFSISIAGAKGNEFEVAIEVTAHWNEDLLALDIETNLPDETELMLSISRANYNDISPDNFMAQTKVTIVDGKASFEGFSHKGNKMAGGYDLCISMSLPSLQSDAVRAVIGEKGENMTGDYAKEDPDFESKMVEAIFTVMAANDEITVTPAEDYQYTVFREDDE